MHVFDLTRRIESSFTSCYDHTSVQEDIFENDVRPMIDVVYSGVVSILAVHPVGKLVDLQFIDCDRLCLRGDIFWEDTHDARYKG